MTVHVTADKYTHSFTLEHDDLKRGLWVRIEFEVDAEWRDRGAPTDDWGWDTDLMVIRALRGWLSGPNEDEVPMTVDQLNAAYLDYYGAMESWAKERMDGMDAPEAIGPDTKDER